MATLLQASPVDSTTREAILDVAERRFADRGFDGVSVREIATEAGLKNQASLYHHFAHKQAIYEAVLRRGIDVLSVVVAESERVGVLREPDASSREQRVAAYLDRVVDELTAHPSLARLIQRASFDDSVVGREVLLRLVQPLYADGVHMLRDSSGLWQPDQLPHLAAGLYHLVFGYFADTALLRSVMDEDPASAVAVERQRVFLRSAVGMLLGVHISADRPEKEKQL
jgi:AcrR family transcriptional regulator